MKKVFFMLTAAALMVSCSNDNNNAPVVNGEGVAIQVKSAHQAVNGEVSRVPFIGNINADNKLEARVVTYDITAGSGAVHADGTMIFKATDGATVYESLNTAPATAKFGTTGAGIFNLIGLYPADGWDFNDDGINEVATDYADDEVTFTFTGKEDVMVAGYVETTPAQVSAATPVYPTLVFKHQLTKLEIKVKAKDAAAAAVWSELTSIELTKVLGTSLNNVFTYKVDSAAFALPTTTEFSGSTPAFSFFGISHNIAVSTSPIYSGDPFTATPAPIAELPVGETAKPVAYSMIAPFLSTGTATDLTFTIEAIYDEDGAGSGSAPAPETKTVKVSIPKVSPTNADGTPLTSTKGYAYSILFTFADTGLITATAEVIDWKNGGESEQVIL